MCWIQIAQIGGAQTVLVRVPGCSNAAAPCALQEQEVIRATWDRKFFVKAMNDDGVLEERDRTETQKDAQRFMAHPRATEGELTAF